MSHKPSKASAAAVKARVQAMMGPPPHEGIPKEALTYQQRDDRLAYHVQMSRNMNHIMGRGGANGGGGGSGGARSGGGGGEKRPRSGRDDDEDNDRDGQDRYANDADFIDDLSFFGGLNAPVHGGSEPTPAAALYGMSDVTAYQYQFAAYQEAAAAAAAAAIPHAQQQQQQHQQQQHQRQMSRRIQFEPDLPPVAHVTQEEERRRHRQAGGQRLPLQADDDELFFAQYQQRTSSAYVPVVPGSTRADNDDELPKSVSNSPTNVEGGDLHYYAHAHYSQQQQTVPLSAYHAPTAAALLPPLHQQLQQQSVSPASQIVAASEAEQQHVHEVLQQVQIMQALMGERPVLDTMSLSGGGGSAGLLPIPSGGPPPAPANHQPQLPPSSPSGGAASLLAPAASSLLGAVSYRNVASLPVVSGFGFSQNGQPSGALPPPPAVVPPPPPSSVAPYQHQQLASSPSAAAVESSSPPQPVAPYVRPLLASVASVTSFFGSSSSSKASAGASTAPRVVAPPPVGRVVPPPPMPRPVVVPPPSVVPPTMGVTSVPATITSPATTTVADAPPPVDDYAERMERLRQLEAEKAALRLRSLTQRMCDFEGDSRKFLADTEARAFVDMIERQQRAIAASIKDLFNNEALKRVVVGAEHAMHLRKMAAACEEQRLALLRRQAASRKQQQQQQHRVSTQDTVMVSNYGSTPTLVKIADCAAATGASAATKPSGAAAVHTPSAAAPTKKAVVPTPPSAAPAPAAVPAEPMISRRSGFPAPPSTSLFLGHVWPALPSKPEPKQGKQAADGNADGPSAPLQNSSTNLNLHACKSASKVAGIAARIPEALSSVDRNGDTALHHHLKLVCWGRQQSYLYHKKTAPCNAVAPEVDPKGEDDETEQKEDADYVYSEEDEGADLSPSAAPMLAPKGMRTQKFRKLIPPVTSKGQRKRARKRLLGEGLDPAEVEAKIAVMVPVVNPKIPLATVGKVWERFDTVITNRIETRYEGNHGTTLSQKEVNAHKEIVRELVCAGADVNARNRDGLTPFMLCCINLAGGSHRQTDRFGRVREDIKPYTFANHLQFAKMYPANADAQHVHNCMEMASVLAFYEECDVASQVTLRLPAIVSEITGATIESERVVVTSALQMLIEGAGACGMATSDLNSIHWQRWKGHSTQEKKGWTGDVDLRVRFPANTATRQHTHAQLTLLTPLQLALQLVTAKRITEFDGNAMHSLLDRLDVQTWGAIANRYLAATGKATVATNDGNTAAAANDSKIGCKTGRSEVAANVAALLSATPSTGFKMPTVAIGATNAEDDDADADESTNVGGSKRIRNPNSLTAVLSSINPLSSTGFKMPAVAVGASNDDVADDDDTTAGILPAPPQQLRRPRITSEGILGDAPAISPMSTAPNSPTQSDAEDDEAGDDNTKTSTSTTTTAVTADVAAAAPRKIIATKQRTDSTATMMDSYSDAVKALAEALRDAKADGRDVHAFRVASAAKELQDTLITRMLELPLCNLSFRRNGAMTITREGGATLNSTSSKLKTATATTSPAVAEVPPPPPIEDSSLSIIEKVYCYYSKARPYWFGLFRGAFTSTTTATASDASPASPLSPTPTTSSASSPPSSSSAAAAVASMPVIENLNDAVAFGVAASYDLECAVGALNVQGVKDALAFGAYLNTFGAAKMQQLVALEEIKFQHLYQHLQTMDIAGAPDPVKSMVATSPIGDFSTIFNINRLPTRPHLIANLIEHSVATGAERCAKISYLSLLRRVPAALSSDATDASDYNDPAAYMSWMTPAQVIPEDDAAAISRGVSSTVCEIVALLIDAGANVFGAITDINFGTATVSFTDIMGAHRKVAKKKSGVALTTTTARRYFPIAKAPSMGNQHSTILLCEMFEAVSKAVEKRPEIDLHCPTTIPTGICPLAHSVLVPAFAAVGGAASSLTPSSTISLESQWESLPLMAAIRHGNPDVVKFLLFKGAGKPWVEAAYSRNNFLPPHLRNEKKSREGFIGGVKVTSRACPKEVALERSVVYEGTVTPIVVPPMFTHPDDSAAAGSLSACPPSKKTPAVTLTVPTPSAYAKRIGRLDMHAVLLLMARMDELRHGLSRSQHSLTPSYEAGIISGMLRE